MGERSTNKVDKRDSVILYELDKNGRAPFTQIAKKAGISKQLARFRIERLEHAGLVKGYSAMIDASRLGFITFRTYLKLRNSSPETHNAIVEYCRAQGAVWAIVMVAGKWDLAIGISVKDIYEYYAVWEALLKTHLEHIAEYHTCVYSPTYHYTKAYLVGKDETASTRIVGGGSPQDHDEKDLLILQHLAKDARSPLISIAPSVQLTPEAVSARIKHLESVGIIQGYRALIDVHLLGYEYYKAEIRLSRYDQIGSIMTFCQMHPNIYQVDKTIGGETLEVEFHVHSLREMLSIIASLEKTFPGVIERFDYLTVLDELKMIYLPSIERV
jgi:DNA-binding Lrp family transcriptional regulator